MYFSKALCNYKREDIPFISRDKVSQKIRTVVIVSAKNLVPFSYYRCKMCLGFNSR